MLAAAIAVAIAAFGMPRCDVHAYRADPGVIRAAAVKAGLPDRRYSGLTWVGPTSCLILVDTTLRRRWRCTVTSHEWLHAKGYRHPIGFRRRDGTYDHAHSPDPDALMYPSTEHVFRPCRASPPPVPSGVHATVPRMDSIIAETETVMLGTRPYGVAPQPLPLLKRELGPLLDQLSEADLDTANFADALTGGAHRLLKVFIPDLMPVYEWEGYSTSDQMAAGELDADTARRLAPTAPQIKQAVKVAAKVNGLDLWNTLGSFVDPTTVGRWLDDLRAFVIKEMRSRSTSSASSSSEGSDSRSSTLPTIADREASATLSATG